MFDKDGYVSAIRNIVPRVTLCDILHVVEAALTQTEIKGNKVKKRLPALFRSYKLHILLLSKSSKVHEHSIAFVGKFPSAKTDYLIFYIYVL